MKKSLLALAALTAFAGASYAQSSLTLSGGIDLGVARLGVENADGSVDTDTVLQTAGKSARSNLTFSGKEDLGGGMYASFVLNHRFNPENGTVNPGSNGPTENQFWRNSFVELGGGFGAVRLGRYLVPLQELNGNYDAFGTDTVGSVHTGGIAGNVRANQAVEYRSPNLGGFQVLGMIAAGDAQGNRSGDERAAGLSARYAAGPVDVAVAWDRTGSDLATVGVYGKYNWGGGAVMGQYERGETVVGSSDKVKRYSISTKIPVGAIDLKAGYARWADEELRKFGLGADYNLSKRTQLYVDMGKWSGDGASEALKKTQFDVGIYHRF